MDISWTPAFFRQSAESLLAFANLPAIADVDQVHAIFAPVVLASQVGVVPHPTMQVIAPKDIGEFRSDQKRVRDWLGSLSGEDVRRRQAALLKIEKRFGRTVDLRGSARFVAGELATNVHPVIYGVEGCIAFALAILAGSKAKRWRRIGQCQYKFCGQYFLRDENDLRRQYCTKQHLQREADRKRGKGRQQ